MRLYIVASCLIALCFSAATCISARGQEPSVTASLDNSALPQLKANSEAFFETHIATLLSRHCLDCHDSATKDGNLDLSRKSSAFVGGDSGKVVLPGNSAESLMWQVVESDEMPQNRAALSDEEKERLRRWIDAGAVWNVQVIDPEAYLHDARAAETWLQRLTSSEYIETVRSTVGVDIRDEARRYLPRDQRADGFTNTAYNLGVDLAHVEAYSRLAKMIVSRMDLAAFSSQFTDCSRLNPACIRQLISRMGKLVLRGPLNEKEIAAYVQVADAVSDEGGNYLEAVRYILQAMLQSPRFLYRIERQLGDGDLLIAAPYELASRLSYMLWGGPPDASLMKAAEAGDLSDSSKLKAQIQRMLRDPRAIDRSLQFISEWIDLNRLETLRPNPQRFPQWSDQLARDMRDETLLFFEDLVWKQDRPLAELMNANFTFATPQLAYHYGILGDSPSLASASEDRSEVTTRVQRGLQLLYTFAENGGDVVRDLAGIGEPLDLQIADASRVRWTKRGLLIDSPTMVASTTPPKRLIENIRKSKQLTLEAWVTPANTTQSGPARILTLSNGVSARNFTLGQSADQFEVRLRTTKTSGNGEPSLLSNKAAVSTSPLHVVYTRDASGSATVYLNGQKQGQRKVEGDFSNWDSKFHLAIGNELSGDRAWQGTIHLVAAYDRALSVNEVRQNFIAGGSVYEDKLDSLVVRAAWERTNQKDLVALYRFDEGEGNVVRDQSNAGEPLDLKIETPEAISWAGRSLVVHGSTIIATAKPPKRLVDAIKKSSELTLEAWITAGNDHQDGPARILTLSSNSSQRNFTVGQDKNRYDARLRSSGTDGNGLPSLGSASGSAETSLTHLVYTKDASGVAHLYVNGDLQATRNVGADLSKWDSSFRFALANEFTKDRPWQGVYHLVAIYSRALSAEEIAAKKPGIRRYDLAENSARGGLLTHGSVLTIGGDEASMVARGLFVLHDLLYSRVGNPPACVNTTPIPSKPGLSRRELAETRLADSSCVGCHARFEPLAFGLEKYDGIGAHSEVDEHGNKLREDGEILFPGQPKPIKYSTAAELMDLLAKSERVQMAITRKVTQFALGRPVIAADMPHLQQIHQAAQANGGTYAALMTAIATSDLVTTTRTEAR